MAEDAKNAEKGGCTCSHSHPTVTSWWWIMGWLGTMAFYVLTASESTPETSSLAFVIAILLGAALCYFAWPALLLMEFAEAVLLLRAIAAALEVSV